MRLSRKAMAPFFPRVLSKSSKCPWETERSWLMGGGQAPHEGPWAGGLAHLGIRVLLPQAPRAHAVASASRGTRLTFTEPLPGAEHRGLEIRN